MNFDELVNFFSQNLKIILTTFFIVTPISWGVIDFLYRNRIQEAKAHAENIKLQVLQASELQINDIKSRETTPKTGITPKRISLICSTSHQIEMSKEKNWGLEKFYKSLWTHIERTPFGINTCGAEPFRSVLFNYYIDELRNSSRSHIIELNKRVRWYWFPGDAVGLRFEPGYFESHPAKDANDRTAKEMQASDIIVAFAGRTGTRNQVERLVQAHFNSSNELDLNKKPLILLSWFGGTVKDYIDENMSTLSWLLDKYPELRPSEQIANWFKGDRPDELAGELVRTIQKLIR